MASISHQASFVLHYRPFRETSVLANLITPDFGRIDVIARGARSPKSRRRPLLQPFRPLLASWTGRSELKTLTGLEEKGSAVHLDDQSLGCAYYVTELILRLVSPGEGNLRAFAVYAETLTRLAQTSDESEDIKNERILRLFELEFLDSLGLLPDFSHCDVNAEPISASANYQFDCHSGRATARSSVSNEAVSVAGETLLALGAKNVTDKQVLKESKRLLRQILRVHLGDKPLNSRAVYAEFYSAKNREDKP